MVSTVKCIISLYFGRFLKMIWIFKWFPLNISKMKHTYACYIMKILLTQNAETKIDFEEEWNEFKYSSHLEIRTDQDYFISYLNLWSIYRIAKKINVNFSGCKKFPKSKMIFFISLILTFHLLHWISQFHFYRYLASNILFLFIFYLFEDNMSKVEVKNK